MKHMKNVL